MLVSRELLTLIKSMVAEFKRWGRDAVPESTVHAEYIAIVCMLRSVGQVAHKVDFVEPAEAKFLEDRWPDWQRDEVFRTFIEPARNDLLKEFKSGLQLKGGEVSRVFYADPEAPSGVTTALNFDAADFKDIHGRSVIPLFEEAIAFWDRRLREVESFRAKEAR